MHLEDYDSDIMIGRAKRAKCSSFPYKPTGADPLALYWPKAPLKSNKKDDKKRKQDEEKEKK